MPYRNARDWWAMKKLALIGLPLWVSCSAAGSQHRFHEIQPLQREIRVPNVSKADVRIKIRGNSGKPLYLLECHSAGYNRDPSFDYSGDFECRLTDLINRASFSTLLTEDEKQSRDWESRGRFFLRSITGKCAQIPQFGSRRSFRLRGMVITLQIRNPIIGPDILLKSLSLAVSVRPDAGAKRQIAERVQLPRSFPPECKISEYFN
jgi:hypothetical protein